ncbi:MAG: FMN-binding domain protein [Planctomycetes bacterium ADurb.Bin126]|nr:MAG: FMN-binding domain protein [Planctomycetes bacterium ADurb.Bin126]HOD81578.1 FMN-binding protein [Phycisphaerae bacterium]HQL71870.1 FMN-binding protein [Phycisphaerae bacterium]
MVRRSGGDVRTWWPAALVLAAALGGTGIVTGDTIESTSGSVVEGKIVSRDAMSVVIEVQAGGRTLNRRYPLHMIKALTIDGKREVLGAGGAAGNDPAPASKSRQEIDALIAQAGRTPPDWLEATPLSYPKTLDLSWPDRPPGGWNNQRNVGQYVWDVINPNPSRWKEGVKFMLHLADLHKGDPNRRDRAWASLASMYQKLHRDYARAAWWWRQVSPQRRNETALAECYWKLGSKAMAMEILDRLQTISVSDIKLLGEMGQTDQAIKLAGLFANHPGADEAVLAAGDACRTVGRYKEAVALYQKVLDMPNQKHNQRSKNRARANLEAIQLFDTLDISKVPDGTYSASSMGYEAPVTVEVVVRSGRIESLKVTHHREKQYYSAMVETPNQIIRKQSVKGIDAVTSATITCDAIVNATAKALHGAMK